MSDSFRPPGSAAPRSGRRLRHLLILAGVAVAALGSGAGVALAITSGGGSPVTSASPLAAAPSPSPSGSRLPRRMFIPGHHRFIGPGFFAGPAFRGPAGAIMGPLAGPGLFGAVHGQIVIPKQGGGYQTVDIQQGTVTAVNATSVTVKSADGFTKTYTVTSSTVVDAQRSGIGSVKAGHKVAVTATQSGNVATARRISDLTLLQQDLLRGRPGFVAPEPSASPSGTAG
jgi:hypothetical protein